MRHHLRLSCRASFSRRGNYPNRKNHRWPLHLLELTGPSGKVQVMEPAPRKPISDLTLSTRTRNSLANMSIEFVDQLAQKTDLELLQGKNFGRQCLREVRKVLGQLGLVLRDRPPQDNVERALLIARRYGGIDGAHHKDWTIDQMVRALTNCPDGETGLGESEAYQEFVAESRVGDEGPNTYDWNVGIAP